MALQFLVQFSFLDKRQMAQTILHNIVQIRIGCIIINFNVYKKKNPFILT